MSSNIVNTDSTYKKLANSAKSNSPGWARARVSLLLDKIIFYALLVVIALTAIPYGTVDPIWAALFECAVFALTVLWIIEGLFSGARRISGRSMLVPLLAMVVFAFVQTLPLWSASGEFAGIEGTVWKAISAAPYETRFVVLKLIAYTLTFALLLRYTYSQFRLRALIYTVIGISLASALFGIIRQGTQHTMGFILPRLKPGQGYGQLIYHNAFASLMVMCFGLILGLALRRGVRRDRLLIYLAIALPIWTALVLSKSRGAIFSMIGQVILLALLYSFRRPSRELRNGETDERLSPSARSIILRVAFITGLIVLLTISVFWIGGDPLAEKVGQDELTTESGKFTERRIDLWRETWPLIKANPIAGVGFGAYWVSIDEYLNRSGKMKPYQAHNDYLDLLASGGIIGVALACWFVVAVIRRAREHLRSTDPFRRAACFGALLGLFGVAVHSLVDFTLQITINAVIFIALIVIATVDVRSTAP
ncbi:MAG: hypothetical protein DMF68_08815 [Acidobacteria bacterium]|nr:MAG: hypothetical protein DMF68_08815 [Acidobacteriota bacterium]